MIFSSYAFLFKFFPVVLLVFMVLVRLRWIRAAKWALILASGYFYAAGCAWFIPFLLISIAGNYILACALARYRENWALATRKLVLLIGLAANIFLLAHYKYSAFFIANLNRWGHLDLPVPDHILPLGISFFTFQIIAYLVDCYRGKTSACSFTDYLLFCSFFPKMLVGPIIRSNDLLPELKSGQMFRLDPDNIRTGFFIFSLGCAKKVLLANPLLLFTANVFPQPELAAPLALWVGMFANLFAIYFDFSGYTDMAIGLGYFFNVRLPENFNAPYRARNVQQYWKRWHLSLTNFLNQYVFNSIYRPGQKIYRFFIGIMITFFISGLWHGAGWNFIIWGLAHGLAVCIVALLALYWPRKHFLPTPLAHASTLIFLLITGILYICPNFSSFIAALKRMADFSYYSALGTAAAGQEIALFCAQEIGLLVILLLSIYIIFFQKTTKELARHCLTDWRYPLLSTAALVLSFFYMGTTSTFFYMGF
jgi:D-alanyl-lipoteichoic acid acyltransferase DltB (MBOAT superfamily)